MLGGGAQSTFWNYLGTFASTLTIDLGNIGINIECIQGTYIIGYGGSTRCGRQGIVHFDSEGGGAIHWIQKPYQWDGNVSSMTISDRVLTLTCGNEWMRIGLRKL